MKAWHRPAACAITFQMGWKQRSRAFLFPQEEDT